MDSIMMNPLRILPSKTSNLISFYEESNYKMKCLVWNMDYWKRTNEQREKAWEYIAGVDADICLLNECSDDSHYDHSIHVKDTGAWGTGVFSKHELTEITEITKQRKVLPIIKSHPASLVPTNLTLYDKNIIAISLYGKIDQDGFAITTLHRSLSDLTPIFSQRMKARWLLIGGDFNADPLIDVQQNDSAHHIFYERLKDFKLHDCCKKFNPERVQTIRHPSSNKKWENDRLFAGKYLYDRLISCEVIDDPNLYELSDHNPIIAEFNLTK